MLPNRALLKLGNKTKIVLGVEMLSLKELHFKKVLVDFVKWSFYKVAQIYTVTKMWMRLNIFLYVKWQSVFLFLYIACSYSLNNERNERKNYEIIERNYPLSIIVFCKYFPQFVFCVLPLSLVIGFVLVWFCNKEILTFYKANWQSAFILVGCLSYFAEPSPWQSINSLMTFI